MMVSSQVACSTKMPWHHLHQCTLQQQESAAATFTLALLTAKQIGSKCECCLQGKELLAPGKSATAADDKKVLIPVQVSSVHWLQPAQSQVRHALLACTPAAAFTAWLEAPALTFTCMTRPVCRTAAQSSLCMWSAAP